MLGIGDASGMFPIDEKTGDFSQPFLKQFASLDDVKRYPWKIVDILPKVLKAGNHAGTLTEEGARLLDVSVAFTNGQEIFPLGHPLFPCLSLISR